MAKLTPQQEDQAYKGCFWLVLAMPLGLALAVSPAFGLVGSIGVFVLGEAVVVGAFLIAAVLAD